ncbi:hypothetical protein B296_00031651 [Ensete ventricosum]|uniref:Uncharacterized protein n=1 Tax=Ensete ventricosum TaxID=4639 RepID=A0A426Y0I6_ENSVE|nr:hypothetical protein B296_00031651 [Ensete ventricosum]
MSNITLAVSYTTTSCKCCMESLVSSVSRSIRDSTLSIRDSASFVSSLPQSLAFVELLQTHFKNIEAGFHHCKSLLVASFPGWRSRLRLLRSRRIPNFSLILFAAAILMSASNSLRVSLHLQPINDCLGQSFINRKVGEAEGVHETTIANEIGGSYNGEQKQQTTLSTIANEATVSDKAYEGDK